MNPLKSIFRAASQLFPLDFLYRLSDVRTLFPYQHVVSDERLPHIAPLYAYKNRRQFESDLDWWLRHFKPLSPESLAAWALRAEPLPSRSFLLSFDDGFREMHEIVAPLLLRKGVPAAFFVNPDFIDNKNLFYRCKLSLVLEQARTDGALLHSAGSRLGLGQPSWPELRRAMLDIHYPQRQLADELGMLAGIDFAAYLRQQQPFLTTEQLKELAGQGFLIGGHSLDHPHYRYLPQEEQLRQTTVSAGFAGGFGNAPFQSFAFPHEDQAVRSSFFQALKQGKGKPIVLFGVQQQRREEGRGIWHRFNAEDPWRTAAQALKPVLLLNALLRLINRRAVIRN